MAQADVQPPDIVKVSPAARYLPFGSIVVQYDYSDFLTLIDRATVAILVDSVARTAESVFDEKTLRLDLTGPRALLEGDHELRLRVADIKGNLAERVDFVGVDLTDPVAAFTAPAQDAVLNTTRPVVTFEYVDPVSNAFASGIDPATGVRLTEDGRDVTAEIQHAAGTGTYRPPADRPLSEGQHVYRLGVNDNAGRLIERERRLNVDTRPPTGRIVSPADGSVIDTFGPPFVARPDQPEDVAGFAMRINGQDVTARAGRTEGGDVAYVPVAGDPVFVVLGLNRLEVDLVDRVGNVGRLESRFTHAAPVPPPDAIPLVIELFVYMRPIPSWDDLLIRTCTRVMVAAREKFGGKGVAIPGPLLVSSDRLTLLEIRDPASPYPVPRFYSGNLSGPFTVTVEVAGDASVAPLVIPGLIRTPSAAVAVLEGSNVARVVGGALTLEVVEQSVGPTLVRPEVTVGTMQGTEFVETTDLVTSAPFQLETRGSYHVAVSANAPGDYRVRFTFPEAPDIGVVEVPVKFEADLEVFYHDSFFFPFVSATSRTVRVPGCIRSGNMQIKAAGQRAFHPIEFDVTPIANLLSHVGQPEICLFFGVSGIGGCDIHLSGPPYSGRFYLEWGGKRFVWVAGIAYGQGGFPAGGFAAASSPITVVWGTPPEVRIVKKQADGGFKGTNFTPMGRVFTRDWTTAARVEQDEYYVEVRGPVSEGPATPKHVRVAQRDSCGAITGDVPRQIGVREQEVTLGELDRTDRFIRYRSPVIVNCQQRAPPDLVLETPPDLVVLFGHVGGQTEATATEFGVSILGTNSGIAFQDFQGLDTEIITTFLPRSGLGGGGITNRLLDASEHQVNLRLSGPLSPTLPDTVAILFATRYLGAIETILVEDGSDSRRFSSADGSVVLQLTGPVGSDPGAVDELTALLSYSGTDGGSGIAVNELGLTLQETEPSSLVFANFVPQPAKDLPAAEPGSAVFRVLGISSTHPEGPWIATLRSPVESISIVLEPVGSGRFRSGKLLVVPMGADLTLIPHREEFSILHAGASSDPGFEFTVAGSPDGDDADQKSEAIAFASVKGWKRWSTGARKILTEDLGVRVAADDLLTKPRALELVAAHSIWYSATHGYLPDKVFAGIILASPSGDWKKDAILTPADLPAGLAYDLVFLDGCSTAENSSFNPDDPIGDHQTWKESLVTRAFINAFKAKCFVGWQTEIHAFQWGYAEALMKSFFEKLNQKKSVADAIDAVQANPILSDYVKKRIKLLSASGEDPAKVIIDRTE